MTAPGRRAAQNGRSLQTTPQCSPVIRIATFDDYEGIAAVLARNGLRMLSYQDWKEDFTANPVYQERRTSWPIGWVLEAGNEGIVGALGNIPTSYRLGSRVLLAATACNWAVDQGYRAYSLLLLHRLTKQTDVDLLFCTTVSANSECGYQAFEWSKVPVGMWDKSALWITNYTGFAKNLLQLKRVPFGRVLSYPAAGALFIRELVARAGTSTTLERNGHIELRPDFDKDFDAFWETHVSQNSDLLLAERSREMLAWHYRRALISGTLRIVTARRNGRMVGYVIVDRSDSVQASITRARILDLQTLKGHEDVARSIIHWTIRKCRQDGIDVLEHNGCWLEGRKELTITAPSHRRFPSWTFYYKVPDPQLNEALKNPRLWAPTSFDGDASL